MFTALCRANTMPVKIEATRATPSERMPMVSISTMTSRKYFGGRARLRRTWAADNPTPPRPREAVEEPLETPPRGVESRRLGDVEQVVHAPLALQRVALDPHPLVALPHPSFQQAVPRHPPVDRRLVPPPHRAVSHSEQQLLDEPTPPPTRDLRIAHGVGQHARRRATVAQ